MLLELAKTAAVLLALLALWMAVQRGWRRAFPHPGAEEWDPTAGRPGCGGCAHGERCGSRTPT